jgi:hypothetical protein
MEWRVEAGPDPLLLRVTFSDDETIVPDPLYASLGLRSVDRGRYRIRKLTTTERLAMEAALDGRLRIDWHSTALSRWRFARLSGTGTHIRVRTPETFPVHQRIIDWDVNLSPAKIPAGALGLLRPTKRIMRWAMRDWPRMQLLNRLGGTVLAALEMDYVPILSSAAAFTLRCHAGVQDERKTVDLLHAGIHIQRFWLTAARLGLALQPTLAMLAFAHYGESDLPFTADTAVRAKATRLAKVFRSAFGAGPEDFVFMGRIGEPLPRMGVCRSVRRPLVELMTTLQ